MKIQKAVVTLTMELNIGLIVVEMERSPTMHFMSCKWLHEAPRMELITVVYISFEYVMSAAVCQVTCENTLKPTFYSIFEV